MFTIGWEKVGKWSWKCLDSSQPSSCTRNTLSHQMILRMRAWMFSLARVKRRTLPRWMLLLLLSSAQITKKVSFKVGSSFLIIWTLTWSNSALKPLKNHRLNPFQYNSLRLLHPQNFVSQCIDNDQVLVIEFSTYLDTPWLSCFPILSL